eukprot:jgi/Undpi1/14033/HiC_scaffold_9.g03684.m1
MIYMRVANMALCVLLAATALSKLLFSGLDVSGAVLACYLFAFSCILCCFETHLKVVAKTIAANFGFLYNAVGRAIFLVFVGVICFSLDELLAYIAGALMMANAAFNFYVIFKYPEFERDLQRKDLESEGRDYLRANRGALAQAGVEFARNNPDLARKFDTLSEAVVDGGEWPMGSGRWTLPLLPQKNVAGLLVARRLPRERRPGRRGAEAAASSTYV